jgi:hypothetical protein
LIANCFVGFNGEPVASVKTGIRSAVGLGSRPTPHAATLLMQRSVAVQKAAGFLGMSAEMLLGTYGHHHPDFLHGASPRPPVRFGCALPIPENRAHS